MSTNGHGHKIDFGARRKTVTVEVPELEATLTLRALSVGHMKTMRATYTADRPLDLLIEQLSLALVDANGQPLYTREEIAEMSMGVFDTLSLALNQLHGVTPQAVEDTKKNSEATPSTASASDSPNTSAAP